MKSSEAASLWETLWVEMMMSIFVCLGEDRRNQPATGEHAPRKQNVST